ncbi:colanic acid biosynthesis glycosyltransferase WcaL, partial [Candidatus Poribacteria bacterium]|nr:colanic acid biosynthesis glycosyltransferase WcaL [Candidatus Poribacteria bacterium]
MMINNDFPIIAHVMRGYLGRTETFIGNQINILRNYRSVIFCHHQLNGHGYPQDNVISVVNNLPHGIRIFDRIAYSSARILLPMAVDILVEQASKLSVSLIHFHFLVDARFFLSLKRKTGLPAIASAYGYDVSSFPRWYKGYGMRYLKPLFTEIEFFLAMSQDMKKDMINLGFPEEKIIVHYHGIDTKRFLYPERKYSDKDGVNILVCGTLEIKKAQHLVLKALRSVEKQRMTEKNFHITFVGDGPMRHYLERQVRDYGWEKKVTFAGFIPHYKEDLVSEYKKADIFSLPSITVKE